MLLLNMIQLKKYWKVGFALMMHSLAVLPCSAKPADRRAEKVYEEIRHTIKRSWSDLERNHSDLINAAIDPKMPGDGVLFVSDKEDLDSVKKEVAQFTSKSLRPVKIETFSSRTQVFKNHGIL